MRLAQWQDWPTAAERHHVAVLYASGEIVAPVDAELYLVSDDGTSISIGSAESGDLQASVEALGRTTDATA